VRQSEIVRLCWGDLDLSDSPVVNIAAQLGRYGERVA